MGLDTGSSATTLGNTSASEKARGLPSQGPDGRTGGDTAKSQRYRVLSSALLFGLLTGMRSGEICGLLASDVISKGNLGRFIMIQPNAIRQLKSKAAAREVPLHQVLEQLLDTSLPRQGRLFPTLNVDKVVKAYAKLRISLSKPNGHCVPLHTEVVHHPV